MGENDSSAAKLAATLRDRRLQAGMTLEALSAVSGVSRAMLSKVERGQSVPSTTVLSRIAEALGATFSELLNVQDETEVLHMPAARQPVFTDPESGFVRRCLSPILPGRGIDWVLNTLPPHGSTGEFSAHRAGTEEYIYVLKGRIIAMVGKQQVDLAEGDALFFKASSVHQFRNPGARPASYFLVIDSKTARGSAR
jgi:transcriptional regulator with XRE-family HTH domain